MLAANDEIIGKPYDEAVPFHPWLDLFHEPIIQYMVEIDVRQHRGNDPALRRSFLAVADYLSFHYSRIQPFPYEPHQPTIIDSLLQDLPKPFLVKVVEKSCYVCVYQPLDAIPSYTSLGVPSVLGEHCVLLGTRAGEVVEVLLIHRSQ